MFSFGGGFIGHKLFLWLVNNVLIGSTLLELGSGPGTGLLSNFYQMYSVEEDLTWVDKYDSTYIHAPIIDEWYDPKVIETQLPAEYDALFVDGPKGSARRARFIDYVDLFRKDITFVFDDVHRTLDNEMYVRVCTLFAREPEIYVEGDKAFGVIVSAEC